MAWTTPKTWATSELVTAAMLNTHVRDNLNFLLSGRGVSLAALNTPGTYSTTSTSFVDVNASWEVSLTPESSRVLVLAGVTIKGSSTNSYWRINQVSGTAGDTLTIAGAGIYHVSYAQLWTVTPGAATSWRVQWKVQSGTMYLNDWTGPYTAWLMAVEL